jgi:hypothetical protein
MLDIAEGLNQQIAKVHDCLFKAAINKRRLSIFIRRRPVFCSFPINLRSVDKTGFHVSMYPWQVRAQFRHRLLIPYILLFVLIVPPGSLHAIKQF